MAVNYKTKCARKDENIKQIQINKDSTLTLKTRNVVHSYHTETRSSMKINWLDSTGINWH